MTPLSIDYDADASPVLTLALIKAHCRIDEGNSDLDAILMDVYLPSAVAWAEGEMRRSIQAKTHRWVLDQFPAGQIRLPRGKTQAVESIAYTSGGSVTTLKGPTSVAPGTAYTESLRGNDGGCVMPKVGSSWPSADIDVPAPIVITYTAGWTAAQIPADVKAALLHDIEERVNGEPQPVKDTLLSGWRLVRWY